LDIRQLAYFLSVVEFEGFTKAAQRLNVAQTALSYHVRNLEDELGVKLLLRSVRGITPTEAGLELAEYAKRILALTEEAKQRVADFSGPPHGRLVVGMPSSVIVILAAPLLGLCRSRYPGIALNLVEDRSAVLTDWVQTGQLDLALAFDVPASKQLVTVPLLAEDLFFVQNAATAQASGPIAFAEVLDYRLCIPGFSHGVRRTIEQKAAEAGKPVEILFEMRSALAAREFAELNISPTILPFGVVQRQVADGRLVARRIIDPAISRTLLLISSQRRVATKAERAVREVLAEIVTDAVTRLPEAWRLYPGATASPVGEG
jgi:LysR family transcriptional regulator, nitrogen assimilation regulatory protein